MWEEVARQELATSFAGVSVSYLADLPLDELTRQIGALPRRSALLYLTMFEDATGQTYTAPEIAGLLAKAAPVYSVYSTYLDRGIVGGYMESFEAIGREAGRLALRILAGDLRPSGGSVSIDGVDAVHTNKTNTRLTDPEILERRYPILLESIGIRPPKTMPLSLRSLQSFWRSR